MGGQSGDLTGPDFSAGVAIDSLHDGAPMLGHAGGDAILMTRFGQEIVAIAASCTHYGGPLAEGKADGDTVRCPWHHACFSLRTGEALRAPALNPLATWRVEQKDGRAFVHDKIERDPLAPTLAMRSTTPPKSVVIVGAGAAGSAAAEMLRRLGYEGAITMIDGDADAPYDRPNLSKDYLAGNAPEEWIPIRPPSFYKDHKITIVADTVASVDAPRRSVRLAGGATLDYGALVIATGAEPIRPPMPGGNLPHVHTLRTLADSRTIIAAAKTSKRAVVIGASFIGLEVAASLRSRNVEVHVVAPEAVPLARVMGDDIGSFVRSYHEEHGVVFHLGTTASEITAAEVVLADGTRLAADLVIVGIGVKPRLGVAESAGVAIEKGVVVNEFLETSVEGIWAVGDIARFPDQSTGDAIRVEHWVVAQRMGQAAARNILGAKEPFDDVPFFWSAHYNVSINYVGHAEKWDRIETSGSAMGKDFSARFMANGKILAVATIFRDEESLNAEDEIRRPVEL